MSNNNTFVSMAANAEITTSNSKLSESELRQLVKQAKKGDVNARNKLLLANMGLIYKIASQVKNPKANREDLVSDACIRFLEIIGDYNPDVAELSTFVWRPLIQYMNKNITDFKPRLNQFVAAYKEAESYLFDKFGRAPTLEELAYNMGISLKLLKKRLGDISVRNHISLDTPVDSSDSDSMTLMDSQFCATSSDASSDLIAEDERKCEKLAWNRLSEEEQKTLLLRLNGNGKKMSLREAAKQTGLSTETIRLREIDAKKHFSEILDEYGIMAA